MSTLGTVISIVLQVFLIALFGRLIFDYVRMFSQSWRPKGIVLLIAEFIYFLTDPPVNFVRRFIPPLRIGPVALDLSYIVIFFAVQILSRLVLTL
jgi:YggT family protein